MKLRKWFAGPVGALALCMAAPAAAQDEDMSQAEMAEFGEMMGGLFQAEPLTEEQEALLPLAEDVVAKLLPDGFYAEIMEDMMGSTMRPFLSMFSGPSFVVMSSVSLDNGLPELSEVEMAELAGVLDPEYATRGDAIVAAMTDGMGDMLAVMEGPMREGMAKYYVTRFTGPQLGEINAFFETPTGALFARESMAMAADPQFMSSIMGSMPEMMDQMGDFETRMEGAMENIPDAKTFDALTADERTRAAALLGISVPELRAAMERAAQQAAEEEEEDFDVED